MKGQELNGECNRTACTNKKAFYWNTVTLAFYCPSCAHEISKWNKENIFIVKNKQDASNQNKTATEEK